MVKRECRRKICTLFIIYTSSVAQARHLPLKVEGIFSEAHLHCADTVIAVARPETADKTVTARSLREAQFYGFHSTLDTGFTQKTHP